MFNVLKADGVVMISVGELVVPKLRGSESVGVMVKLLEVVVVVILRAVRLKLPVVPKRATAS